MHVKNLDRHPKKDLSTSQKHMQLELVKVSRN